MKHEPLKITIAITIAVCIAAIAAWMIFFTPGDEPEDKIVNTTAVDVNKSIPEKNTEHHTKRPNI